MSGAGETGKDWPEPPGRAPQPTLGPPEFCMAKTRRVSINDSLKKQSLSFCFYDLLFMSHIFNYLKAKCLVRNTILIIKSFTWEKSELLFKKLLYLVVIRGDLLQRGGGMRSTTKSSKCQNLLSTIPTHVLWILTNTILGLQGTETHSQQQNLMRKSCRE